MSERAIQRRIRQGIPIQENDLPVNASYIQEVKNLGNITYHYASRWFNAILVQTNDMSVIAQISALPFVKNVSSVKELPISKSGTVSSTQQLSDKTAYLENYSRPKGNAISKKNNNYSLDYGLGFNQAEMVEIPFLHDKGYRGKGMHIAIIDAGFRNLNSLSAFDSLWDNNRILGMRDFVNPNSNIFAEHSHGMAVLSTIGANVPGQFIGVAPEASFWLLRSEDAATEYPIEECNWTVAAEFADSVGVDIINSSLGYTTFDNPKYNYSYQQMDGETTIVTRAANTAAEKGILVVNSAGNYGSQAWKYIGAPADGHNVLTVGATNAAGEYVSFSSQGPSYDGRVKPIVTAQGFLTYIVNTDGQIRQGSGTSFSSPIIAGMAACLWQVNPNLTRNQLVEIIKESASQYQTPDFLMGYGIPKMSWAYAAARELIIEKPDGDALQIFIAAIEKALVIKWYGEKEDKALLEVFDISGKRIFIHENLEIRKGANEFKIPLHNFLSNTSLLMIRFSTSDMIRTKKVVSVLK